MFNFKFKPLVKSVITQMPSDNIIEHEVEGMQEDMPFNAEATGYVLGGIRYIPLGIVDTDFSTAVSEQRIDFMRISDDLDGFAYLSSGQVYNGSSAAITLVLYSQYTTFGQPRITLNAGSYYSWSDAPITGVFSSNATPPSVHDMVYVADEPAVASMRALTSYRVSDTVDENIVIGEASAAVTPVRRSGVP